MLKLESLGVMNIIVRWVMEYLTHATQNYLDFIIEVNVFVDSMIEIFKISLGTFIFTKSS